VLYGTYFIEIYDAEANLNAFELIVENSWLPSIAWNNGGDLMAIYAGDEIKIYDMQSSETILTIPAYRIRSLSWHPDDTLLAGGSADGTIRIWDVSDLIRSTP
jgi:WD40 repeat protein